MHCHRKLGKKKLLALLCALSVAQCFFNAEKRSSVCKDKGEEIGKGLGRSAMLVVNEIKPQ